MKSVIVFFFVTMVCVARTHAQAVPAIGWFPTPGATTTYHYHVKSTWYDTRIVTLSGGTQRSLLGFTFKETGATNYYYPYDYANAAEVGKANGIYSTLMGAIATNTELNIHLFRLDSSYWLFDAAQIGAPN